MLRELVSGLGRGFFPIAALLLFVAVYLSVITRSLIKHRKGYWDRMSAFVLEDNEQDAERTEGER
jgi:cbb3-type cytochrome oxidase subunit 3